MQSSALAFASICGGDLTSMMYSKYHILLSYWNTVYVSWDFFNGEQITSLQKPKIDFMILFCEILSNHSSFQNDSPAVK